MKNDKNFDLLGKSMDVSKHRIMDEAKNWLRK